MGDSVVMTVLGPISPGDLGVTLAHEHFLIDVSVWFVEPEEASRRRDANRPVDMSMLSDLRRRPFSTTRDNIVLNDEDVAIDELALFSRAGGRSVVEVTPIGLGRDPLALQRISRATGLHVVMGTSFYVEGGHPEWVADMSIDEIAALFVRDIVEGTGPARVKAGIIGEIGISGMPKGWGRRKSGPITEQEEKVLRAGARASLETGLPVGIHIDPLEPRGTFPALDVLIEQEGLSPDRVIVNHMDQIGELDYHLAVADRGVYCEYDSLGREHYSEEWGSYNFNWGHDSWRVQFAKRLIDDGYGDRLLFSQDVCLKTDLRRFGGPGYAHALNNIVPSLRELQVSAEAIRAILVDNPARVLSHRPQAGADPVLEALGQSESRD